MVVFKEFLLKFFVEFKIVPNCDIIALYDKPTKVDNPYITVTPLK